MSLEGLQGLLKGVAIFRELDAQELMDIIRTCRFAQVRPGEVIFDMGQPGDAMYIIDQGQVRIVLPLPDGSREILANLEAGQCFGEMAVLDGSPRAARAVAVSPCRLYRIEREALAVLRANRLPAVFKLERALARVLAERLRASNQRLVTFFADPASTLQHLARHQATG